MRGIMVERRHVWEQAVRQAERLAAEHDPSGVSFNVRAVTKLEDGSVVALETLARREERKREKEAKEARQAELQAAQERGEDVPMEDVDDRHEPTTNGEPNKDQPVQEHQPDAKSRRPGISKSQQRKLAKYEPRPPPPKPILPEGVSIPEGEENFIEMWDFPDEEFERRVKRAKRRAAEVRKDLRRRQQAGKAERRLARDEKRKTYRDIKLVWKMINQERVKERTRMQALEDEEARKIAVEIAKIERQRAMAVCHSLGCTIANTEGTAAIEPNLPGLQGQEVDWSVLTQDFSEAAKNMMPEAMFSSKRVDLSTAAKDTEAVSLVPSSIPKPTNNDNTFSADFLSFNQDPSDARHQQQDYDPLNYNHKLRRKLRRAADDALVRQEALVRQKVIAQFKARGFTVPPILLTPLKPLNKLQPRILENGTLETEKQARIRARVELADFNKASKVLRKQAKSKSLEAGLRVHAEATGRIPKRGEKEIREEDEAATVGTGIGEQERRFWEEQFRTNFGAKSYMLVTEGDDDDGDDGGEDQDRVDTVVGAKEFS